MAKVQRPNRILRIPRELHDCLANIAYWQSPAMSTQDFIIDLLSMLSYEHGKLVQIEAVKAQQTMEKLFHKTNVVNDANCNNKFQEIQI